MKKCIMSHFKEKISKPDKVRLILDNVSFRVLSLADKSMLESPFIGEEILEAVWGNENSKIP